MDPALPFFATARQHWKLDSSDGYSNCDNKKPFQVKTVNHFTLLFCRNFVDVIHTNAGVYGKLESCGTVDFYMNNGQFQVNYFIN